jgi:hypothetical protein
MTDDEINAQLAALGFDRRWVDLGVLTEEWIAPDGPWRLTMQTVRRDPPGPSEWLHRALFNYLDDRRAVDDGTLVRLLDIAAQTDEEFSRMVAAWDRLTVHQLVQVVHHNASAPGVHRLRATLGSCASSFTIARACGRAAG